MFTTAFDYFFVFRISSNRKPNLESILLEDAMLANPRKMVCQILLSMSIIIFYCVYFKGSYASRRSKSYVMGTRESNKSMDEQETTNKSFLKSSKKILSGF